MEADATYRYQEGVELMKGVLSSLEMAHLVSSGENEVGKTYHFCTRMTKRLQQFPGFLTAC